MSEPYGQQVPPPPPAPPQQSNNLAIASLVLGILGLVCCGLFAGVPAIICGHLALGQIRRGIAPESGRGYAIAGLILGYVSVVLWILFIIFYGAFFFVAATGTAYQGV